MQCSHCGHTNLTGASYCKNCGSKMATSQVVGNIPSSFPASAAPTMVGQGTYQPHLGHQPPALPVGSGSSPGYSSYPQSYGAPPVSRMGFVGVSPFNLWGPFAGYGSRGRHVAWLLGTLGDRADMLRQAIGARFAARAITDALFVDKILVGKGVAVERRPYFLIQRKLVTAGLYIARLGEDIYISQVTYTRSPISKARIVLFVLMILLQIFFLLGGFGYTLDNLFSSTTLLGGGPDMGAFLFFLCCIGPLGLLNTVALLIAGVISIWRGVTDKDPWVVLRTSLNEFNHDDMIALEKAVEETIRECMDQVGIDRRLLPPAAPSNIRQRLI